MRVDVSSIVSRGDRLSVRASEPKVTVCKTREAKPALMDEMVMMAAQQGHVRHFRRAVVCPVANVVGMSPAGRTITSRKGAPSISGVKRTPLGGRGMSLCHSEIDRGW